MWGERGGHNGPAKSSWSMWAYASAHAVLSTARVGAPGPTTKESVTVRADSGTPSKPAAQQQQQQQKRMDIHTQKYWYWLAVPFCRRCHSTVDFHRQNGTASQYQDLCVRMESVQGHVSYVNTHKFAALRVRYRYFARLCARETTPCHD